MTDPGKGSRPLFALRGLLSAAIGIREGPRGYLVIILGSQKASSHQLANHTRDNTPPIHRLDNIMTDNHIIPEEVCHRRGRPRVRRMISGSPESRCFQPRCSMDENQAVISLSPEEIELVRLIDLDGLEQEEAAQKLGVSRKTAWRDLQEVRQKIADALVNGKGIEIAGCQKAARGQCPCNCTGDTRKPRQETIDTDQSV